MLKLDVTVTKYCRIIPFCSCRKGGFQETDAKREFCTLTSIFLGVPEGAAVTDRSKSYYYNIDNIATSNTDLLPQFEEK